MNEHFTWGKTNSKFKGKFSKPFFLYPLPFTSGSLSSCFVTPEGSSPSYFADAYAYRGMLSTLHSHSRTVKRHTNTVSLEAVKRTPIWTYASGQQEYQMTHPKQFKKPLKNETILFKEFSNWWANLRQDALVSVFKGLTWQPPAVHNLLAPVNKF